MLSPLLVTSSADGGAGSLRAIIGSAPSGSTIEFANSVHNITLTSSELDIATNLDIEGPGANKLTISGNNSSRIFEIAAGNVAVNGLTITDGKEVGASGGGMLVDAGATLDLDQVVVANNSAYADSLGNDGSGGGIENDGSLSVTKCVFTNNLASGGSYTDVITEGSAGGAIDNNGPSMTVTSSAFTNNQAVGPATGTGEGNGGAINNGGNINNSSTATIANSTFNGNRAFGRTTNGGAISTGENESAPPLALAISNCTFTGNQAVGANGANNSTEVFGGEALGGAIANAAPLTITGSTFTDNLAKGGDHGSNLGGVDPNPVVGEVWGGGIVDAFFGSLTVTNTTFTGNQAIGGNSAAGPGAPAAGGGVASEIFADTTLTDVTFVGNQAIGGSGGPGYTGGSGFGGGYYNGVDSNAAVSHALFLDNQAKGGAGGWGAAGGVGAGGAIANGGGAGAFALNYLYGLGLVPSTVDTSALSLAGSTLSFNAAQGGAGGAGANGGSSAGGGVYVLGSTTASIDTTWIVANAALGGFRGWGGLSGQGSGGGLYIDTGAGVTLSKSSKVIFNFASTSADDIFGTYTIS